MQTLLLMWALESAALNLESTVEPSALSDSRYKIRRAEAIRLERDWPLTDQTLKRGLKSKDENIRAECERIRTACVERVLDNPPWADWPMWSLESNYWHYDRFPLYRVAMNRELQRWQSVGYPWENYRAVTYTWGKQAIDAGVPPSIIRLLFRVGNVVDAEYEKSRLPMVFPIE